MSKVLATLFLTFLSHRQKGRCEAVELNYPLDAYHVLQLIHSKGFSVMTFTQGEERQTTRKAPIYSHWQTGMLRHSVCSIYKDSVLNPCLFMVLTQRKKKW